jgi:hypothetical protein
MDLARRMRSKGLSLAEIAGVLPVSKSTLSVWCRPVALSEQQQRDIRERCNPQRGRRRDTQHKRRRAIRRIEKGAREEARGLLRDPHFAAGVALYWAEGSKTQRRLEMVNSDPRLLALFVTWTRRFHDPDARFVGSLNIHADNDVGAAHAFWRSQLPIERLRFTKPYVKPDGTGHRRNRLPNGVCRMRMRASTDAFLRTMAWIDAMALEWGHGVATLPPGR